MSSYEQLLRIKNESRVDHFALALGYFFDIGYQAASEITDEDIANAEGNGIMKKDFVQWMMKTVRLFTEVTDSAIEVIQFCMVEDIFEIRWYANKLPRYQLEDMLQTRIAREKYSTNKEDDLEELCDLYDCDSENFELLGFNIPEEEDE